jgi:hypothetical protein
MGYHFGVPFHRALQREIITTALSRIVEAEERGDVYFFRKTRAQARKEGKQIEREMAGEEIKI